MMLIFQPAEVQRHPVLVPSFQRLDEEEQNLIVYCLKATGNGRIFLDVLGLGRDLQETVDEWFHVVFPIKRVNLWPIFQN